ncbi:MAG TPA: methyl-accepting chemotaxis protein [Symbiobacteriaceae bacterium]|nr:methyl-accepting chemotaxis protein [Symbiobacteriaceae bacterium]
MLRRLNPKNWSLATKWSLMLTALALGPLLAVIRFSYESASTKIIQQTVIAMTHSAADAAASLDDAAAERVRQAQFLASLPTVRDFLALSPAARAGAVGRLQADLTALQSAYPFMESIDLLDAKGVVVYSTAGYKGLDKDSDLMQTVTGGNVYTAGLRTQPGKPGASLVIAAPVLQGSLAGVVRTQSSPDFLSQRVQRDNEREGAGGLGLLLDETGKVIVRSDKAGSTSVALEPGGRVTLEDGSIYYSRSAKLESLPWSYLVALPEARLAAELNEQKSRALLLAIGISLIIGALARLLAIGFTKPLSKMVLATRALAAADLTHELKPGTREDEVGQLEKAFVEAYSQLRRLAARMRLSSILVAEAAGHLHAMAVEAPQVNNSITAASEKLSVVARDLERQVSHFKV